MAISAESTTSRIILNISGEKEEQFFLQRSFYKERGKWLTYTSGGFAVLSGGEESIEPLAVGAGDFIDSFGLQNGLFEYRYIPVSEGLDAPENEFVYSEWVRFGDNDCIGYSFGNYHSPEGAWGTAVTPDDCRYTYLWGTDFKATNGTYFTDEQIQFFIDEATRYLERMLNISIIKTRIKCQAEDRGFVKGTDYDEEEPFYDFSYRKIQRYGMIQTRHRPVISVEKCELVKRDGSNIDLLPDSAVNRQQGVIKFLKRPYMPSDTGRGISTAIGRYGSETFQSHLFYSIDYTAGYKTSDDIPSDLRQIIAKVAAISLLNVIGDGLMSGFSSSSLSMDGISESFSSTQSATSAYFGARIAVYQKEVENYIKDNKYRFGFLPIGAL
nr:MAG TPA: hypothetical protein [Bacteriophage sp.]